MENKNIPVDPYGEKIEKNANYAKALDCLSKGKTEQGLCCARRAYKEIFGVEPDEEKTKQWLMRAIEHGYEPTQTNKVYLAEGLIHYKEAYNNLLAALKKEQIEVDLLPLTQSPKHIWVRDFMPIQLSKNLFFSYKYLPDYLYDSQDYIPDYNTIINCLHLNCISSDIVLDGGNVVRCADKVIMTDKIFKENPKYGKIELLSKLEDLMQAQIILIPWDRHEIFGHADGMVRYISESRVLLNNYADYDPSLRRRLVGALSPHFIVEELEYCSPRYNKLSWAYLNFLQTNNCIFIPGLHAKEDLLAAEQIRQYYPNYKVIQIQGCQQLAQEGGALNCISWNIF